MRSFKAAFELVSFNNIEKFLARKISKVEMGTILVLVGIGIYTAIFSFFTIMRYYTFRTYAWDLGIFNQAFWTTLHDGKFFYYTPELVVNPSGSFFGVHFSPILFFLLPVYAIYPAPETFLVLQSLVLALGALPLYRLVVHVTKFRVAATIFMLTYLSYPPLQGINWFDFHVQSFLPLFFLSAIYFLEKQSWKTYSLFIILSLMCEEHAAMIVLFIGVFAFVQYRGHIASALRERIFKDTTLLAALSTVILAILWYPMTIAIRNAYFPSNPTFLSTLAATGNWAVLGVNDPALIPLYALLYPARAVAALGYDFLIKSSYLLALFLPLCLRSFFRVKYLLPTIPWFFYSLFSNYLPYYTIYNQYPAYVLSFIFIAAAFSIVEYGTDVNLKKVKSRLLLILVFALVASVLVSPLSPIVTMFSPDSGLRPMTQHEQYVNEVIGYIPLNASVLTHNNLFPPVSSRINAYAMPTIGPIWTGKEVECTDFINQTLAKVDYVLVDTQTDPFSSFVVFTLMQENTSFRVLVSADGVILFKKNYNGTANVLSPFRATYDYRTLSLYSGEVISDPNSTSGLVLHFNGTTGGSPMFWFGPRSLLSPGDYNVTLKLKANGIGELFTVNICSDNGQNIIASRSLHGLGYSNTDGWFYESFHLSFDKPITGFEVRATNVSSQSQVYLDYIDVDQAAP